MTSGAIEATAQRFIRQTLAWTSLALENYTPDSELQIRLTLNNSFNSELGDGIYLARRGLLINFNLPDVIVTGGSETLLPISYTQEFNTYITGIGSGGVQPLTNYFVEFIAPPGTADQDNAEATVIFERDEPDCTVFCGREFIGCRLHTEAWSVQPIPGEFIWPDLPSVPDGLRCYTGFQLWLPHVLGF